MSVRSALPKIVAAFSLAAGLLSGAAVTAHADETTVSQDTYRTGWDQNEPGLTPAQVSSSDFGQQFSTAVDGQVYAQPVVVGNTLVVATETNHVYGLDPVSGAIRWTDAYGAPWPASGVTTPGATWSCGDLAPYIGITGTPVYDPASGYVYLVSKEDGGQYHDAPVYKMHAVDPATGNEKPGFPVVISGSPSNDPSTVFTPVQEGQRPGLLLLNGVVYAGFGSVCDHGNWRGFVVGVNTSGQQTAMWADETGAANQGGGIWASGGGLVADAQGHIEFSTGNGVSPPVGPGSSPPATMSESVISLTVQSNGSLKANDFFAPSNAAYLDQNDRDLGSGGVMAVPDGYGTTAIPHLAVTEGKDGRIFLLNRDNLGGMAQGSGGGDANVQTLGPYTGCYCHPAFWGGGGGYVYYSSNGGPLQAFHLGVDGSGNPALALVGQGSINFGYLNEGSPVVTSTGTTAGSSVVWVSKANDMYGNGATLYAYNGTPNADGSLSMLWSAPYGVASKFATPATSGGRVYIGSRDGHVLAFGRPATSVLTGQPVSIGQVNVGANGSGTLTVTASRALNVTGVTTSAPFAVTAPTLPDALATGGTLTVPVTFTPTVAGATTGIVNIATDQGTVGFSVSATGVKAGFATAPATVSFTGQPTGVPISTSVQFTNTGTGSETVSATGAPSAPWSVTGAPAAGTVVPAGGSFTESVTYDPTTAGSSTDQLSVTSTSGTFTVPLSGTSVTGQGHLTITPASLSFGSVPVGTTSPQLSFTVTNDGNIPVTLNKAKAPVGTFSSPNAIAEGQVLGPDQSVQVPVVFSPTTAGALSDSYEITGNTGQGDLYVQLSGTGLATLPQPPTSWQANGSATLSAGAITLTPATTQQSGSAFYTGAVRTDGLTASFTSTFSGGTGGDGATYALVDATKGTDTGTGVAGGGMGFSKLPGLAVVLSSSWNGTAGMGNFVGIAQGPGSGADNLTYLAWAKVPTSLETGSHAVTVTTAGGHVKVGVDGTALLDYVPAAGVLPSNAYVGFTAGTGASTDVHAISNITITPPAAATTGPQILTATPSAVAFGAATVGSTGSQSVTLMNNGTGTETVTAVTAPAAPFGATLPAVGTAVAPGSSVTVPVTFAPTLTGAQNSSFAVTTTSGTVTVSLAGTGQPGGTGGTLPGFTDASWHLNGVASQSGGVVALTTDGMHSSKGDVVNATAVNPIGLHARFTESISSTGTQTGDGMTFALLNAATMSTSSLGHDGSGLGATGLDATVAGLAVFSNFGAGSSPDLGVATTSSGTTGFSTLGYTTNIPALQGATHTIDIQVTAASHLVVSVDGVQELDEAVTLPNKVLVGFTAGVGASTDTFAVSAPTITYSS
ncbi:beta strand repeat-containing protein [Streptacidiphilus jiangxiensis]|uniref:PQQ-like domain-containing protein n=1 Tax=Streptacidiphilus jiangxiensis TaxID=235985 RepID=A0A1H7SRB7_STRJI|nr:choice-of-anchor D domain-containing protein [Streptacidiphilus jiangxiensis]SEL75172.1 PQQ-like domain-containing protein [Streptacidiphilus jiangxiensis]